MKELFLPAMSHFKNGNGWTAATGALRWKVTPGQEDLTCEIWREPWCYELSRVEETKTFPLTEEGIRAMGDWVLERAEEMNARPRETLAETIARRDAVAAERRAADEKG